MSATRDVVIVGAGLSGLCCARELARSGVEALVLDAAGAVGGRVRTDFVDGFRLDRGFQVLLTAYPECRRMLDYRALDLRALYPGAMIRKGDRFHRLADPFRRPLDALAAVASPIGTFSDKLRVARLRGRLRRSALDEIFRRPERTTRDALREAGFSSSIVEGFFRPFFAGVFLDTDLETSSRMFEFVFKMFSEGSTALPAAGMQAIPEQLAAPLPPGAVRLRARVARVAADGVTLEDGETIRARAVCVAASGPDASRLLGSGAPPASRSTVCACFDAPEPPVRGPVLLLDGDARGPANNVCVLSEVSPAYAPPGRALVSVSVVGDAPGDDGALVAAVRGQMRGWFGAGVDAWRLLRLYRIRHALPSQPPGALEPPERPVRRAGGLYACGDWLDSGSIQGAMVSGRRAAEVILGDLGRS